MSEEKRKKQNTKGTANDIDKKVGINIRQRRMEMGLSQGKMATLLGITFQQIQKYEKGANRVAAGRLKEIADILDVTPNYFYDTHHVGVCVKEVRLNKAMRDMPKPIQMAMTNLARAINVELGKGQ